MTTSAEDLLQSALAAQQRSTANADPDYPLVHLTAPVGRLNDPNGLLVDEDTYHAFFQYTPEHPRRLVYWGHATSNDLLHWTHHAPAIVPDSPYDRNGAYSGGAIILDADELSWVDPAVAHTYVLHYTGNLKDAVTGERDATQDAVVSDDLINFTKLAENPVVRRQPEGYTAHWRDPQVWRDAEGYRMLLGTQRENETGTALLYRSEDLRHWQLEGELEIPGFSDTIATGYMWECPNLLRLRDEVDGQYYDVLIICPQGMKPGVEGFENVFPCIYLVGHLRGTRLEDTGGRFAEVDRGFEFYAPQVFAHRREQAPDGKALLMAWVGNAGEDDQPSIHSGNWVHTMSMVRELSLHGGKLIQRPLPVLEDVPNQRSTQAESAAWEESATTYDSALEGDAAGQALASALNLDQTCAALANSRSWRLRATVNLSQEVLIRIGDENSHVDITLGRNYLEVDRSTSAYPHGGSRRVSLPEQVKRSIELIHDRSITELFVDEGELAFTLRSFLPATACGFSVFVKETDAFGNTALTDVSNQGENAVISSITYMKND